MVRKKARRRSSRVEEDPMAGTSNLTDLMLVIAVGFLIFVVLSWNMQEVIFNEDMTPEEKQDVMKNMKAVSEIKQGDTIDDKPDTSEGSGSGYEEMGKVYRDPNTDQLIMIQE